MRLLWYTPNKQRKMIQHRYLVLLSTFVCQFIFGGMVYGTPRMLVAILDTFRVSRAEAGLIPSLLSTFFCFTGLLSGGFLHKYGAKTTCVLGSLTVAISFCASFFATSVLFLSVSIGAVAGTGVSLLFASTSPVVCEHFQGRSQRLALTLTSFGAGVGGMAYSYIVGVMLKRYGIRGTCLLVGGIVFNAAAVSLLWTGRSRSNKVIVTTQQSSSSQSANGDQIPRSLKQNFRNVFTNKTFILFACGNGLHMAAFWNASIYIVDTMVNNQDQISFGSLAPFLYNLLGLFGRVLCGFFQQMKFCSPVDVELLSPIFGICGCLIIAFADSVNIRLIGWCLNGIGNGISVTSLSVTTAALLGPQDLATGIGLILTILGIGSTVGGPLNGYIRDVTGSYTAVFVCTSFIFPLGGIFISAAKIHRVCQRSADTDTTAHLESLVPSNRIL